MNTLRHSDAKCSSLNGAPISAMKALISATIAAVRAVSAAAARARRRAGAASTALAAASASGWRTKVPGEVGDADGRDRVVAVLPVAAVERVHELALAGDDADREAAADHLAVGREVGLDAEQPLGAARVRSGSR